MCTHTHTHTHTKTLTDIYIYINWLPAGVFNCHNSLQGQCGLLLQWMAARVKLSHPRTNTHTHAHMHTQTHTQTQTHTNKPINFIPTSQPTKPT